MRFETLAQIFSETNPDARMQRIGGKVHVQFRANGKWYAYGGSNYAIAERLDLIPASDMHEIAARITRALENGTDAIVDESGAGDTIRALHHVNAWEESAGVDEFDRQLSRYTIATNDGWTTN